MTKVTMKMSNDDLRRLLTGSVDMSAVDEAVRKVFNEQAHEVRQDFGRFAKEVEERIREALNEHAKRLANGIIADTLATMKAVARSETLAVLSEIQAQVAAEKAKSDLSDAETPASEAANETPPETLN